MSVKFQSKLHSGFPQNSKPIVQLINIKPIISHVRFGFCNQINEIPSYLTSTNTKNTIDSVFPFAFQIAV